jgi:shikimate 5-dehydrogenase
MAVETLPCERGKPLAIPEEVGLVVSAIPAADKTVIELDAVRPDLVMADLALGGEPSALVAQGARHGACTIDGIEIRCARTAIEFVQWTGLEPNADLLREALEEFLSA